MTRNYWFLFHCRSLRVELVISQNVYADWF